MIYYKNIDGEVFAYETEHEREQYGASDLVRMTEAEVAAHLAPVAVDPELAVAARRYAAEVGGITVGGMRVDTDDRSKLLINGAAVEAMLDPDYSLRWKTLDGFVVLSGEQVLGVARAVRAHVQACFDREAELLDAVEDGTYTDAMLEQGWPE